MSEYERLKAAMDTTRKAQEVAEEAYYYAVGRSVEAAAEAAMDAATTAATAARLAFATIDPAWQATLSELRDAERRSARLHMEKD